MTKETQVKTRQIIELLKARHPLPEWSTFVELNIGTGGYADRRIDFFAFNVYPSKLYLKIAYEIKITRSDFSRELNNPKKREPAERLADECYFVTPTGLVKLDEVPDGWGLVEVVANGLRVKKRARQQRVGDLPIEFVASIARRSSDPPPVLPPAYWLVAGREVEAEEMQKLASDQVLAQVEKQIYRAKMDAREETEKRLKDAVDLRDLIGKKLGWKFTHTDQLSVWLEDSGRAAYPDSVTRKIAGIKDMIVHLEREICK